MARTHNLAVSLPQITINTDKSSKVFGYPKWTGVGEFSCKADNLESVTYTADKGSMAYWSDEAINREALKLRKSIVCQFEVKKSLLDGGDTDNFSILKDNFDKLWDSGQFSEYRSKYFHGGKIDAKRYYVDFENGCRPGYVFEEDKPGSPRLTTSHDVYVVTIFDNSINTGAHDFRQFAKSVTALTTDHNTHADWIPSNKIRDQIANIARNGGDFSKITADTITLTAQFKDGTKVIKNITLSFDKNGTLCAEIH